MSDRTVWRRSLATDAVDDVAARFLDLAGFADGTLDPDDRERIADWLTRDRAAACDVAAARANAVALDPVPAAPEAVVARAAALVAATPRANNLVAFPPSRREVRRLRGMAQWGSLAAALAMAAWLGFTLGLDTSRTLVVGPQPTATSFLGDMLEAQSPVLVPLGEGSQT